MKSYEELIATGALQRLLDSATVAVGYLLARDGIDALPIYLLAKAIVDCDGGGSHIQNIIDHHEGKAATLMEKILP